MPFLLIPPLQVPGRGPYCFKIHGQTYHLTTTLHPPEGQERLYGRLYIIEGDQAVTTRMSAAPNSQCLRSVMETINTVMEKDSPYVNAFKQMHTVEQEEEQHARPGGKDGVSLSSSVVLTAEDATSQHTMRLQQFFWVRTEHHLQTGTLWG